MYILDEPTSTLDLKTEHSLLKKIEKEKENKIHLIITHRFINIRNVDQVIVLDKGKISSIGSHDQLYLKDPVYTELYNIHAEINA